MSGWEEVLPQLNEPGTLLPPGALEYGVYPGGFDKAMVAVRKEIRAARKAREPHEEKLRQLHWLAALDAWLYARRAKAINVAGCFPTEVLERLAFPYEEFGYEHLPELKVTDRKWLVAAFGEPEQHCKPSEVYAEVYAVAEEMEERDYQERSKPFYATLPPEIRAKVEPAIKRRAAEARAEFERSEAERNRARKERQEAIRQRKAGEGVKNHGGCFSVGVLVLVLTAWVASG